MEHHNYLLRHRRRGERGFTLIELLVVIAVLAILAAIVVFNVTGVTNRGHSSACSTDVKSVQTAVDAYLNDNQAVTPDPFAADVTASTLPPTSTGTNIWTKIVPNYLHTVPTVGNCQTAAMKIAYTNGASVTNGYTITGT